MYKSVCVHQCLIKEDLVGQSKDDGASSINLCKLVYNNLLFVQGEISVWHELCQTNLQSGSNKVRPCLKVDKAP